MRTIKIYETQSRAGNLSRLQLAPHADTEFNNSSEYFRVNTSINSIFKITWHTLEHDLHKHGAMFMTKKEKILQAAQEQFGEHGYTATTLKMIADHAGVASGLVSHYYGNKDNLFLESGGALIDQMLKVLTAKAAQGKNGLDALAIFVQAYFDFTTANRTTFPTLLRSSPFSDEYPNLDRTHIAEKFKRLIIQIEEYLRQGIEDGSIRDVPLSATPFLIYGHIVGAVRTKFLTPFEVQNLFREACQFIVRSVAKD